MKEEFYYVFDKSKKLIGVVRATTPQKAIKQLNGKFAVDLLGEWAFNIFFKATSGVIKYE